MALFEVVLNDKFSNTLLVKADVCQESDGALIFNGNMPNSSVYGCVVAIAAGEWLQCRTSFIDESIFGEN